MEHTRLMAPRMSHHKCKNIGGGSHRTAGTFEFHTGSAPSCQAQRTEGIFSRQK